MRTALEQRPTLAEGVRIVRREHRGEVHYVVKQTEEDKYYRFGEREVGLMRLMDGHRTPEEIADAAQEALGVRPPAGQVADFAQKLKRMGLVERTPTERNLMLMERLRRRRKVRIRQRTTGTLLRLRFSIGDPDRLFDRWVGSLRWLWSPGFVALSLALFAIYLTLIAAHWGEFWNGTKGLYTLQAGVWDFALFYGLFLLIGGIHELGHGLTTKHFGGEVHEIGAMMLYFTPALFCNTNDAWTFQRRSERLWVTFAGPWIQLVIAALAAVVWFLTEPATFLHRISFLAVLVGGITAFLANMNPLIPLDGYYALSDWLEIPNLRPRAFAYWSWLGKRYLMGVDVAPPSVTPRERRVFLVYGGLAMGYTLLFAALALYWLIEIFGRLIGPWIWVLVGLLGLRVAFRVSGRVRALGKAASTAWKVGFLRSRKLRLGVGGGLLLAGLAFVLPWLPRAPGELTVEAVPRAYVRAPVPGILDRVHHVAGDTVEAGEPLATLWSPSLQAELLEAEGRAGELAVEKSRAEARGDPPAAAAAERRLEELRQQLDVLRRLRRDLTLRSPIRGIVVGHRLEEEVGRRLAEGELLAQVASLQGRVAHVRLPLDRAEEISAGQEAALKLRARPRTRFHSTVQSVAPAAEGDWLEVRIPMPEARWTPSPGMTGIAKIKTRRVSLAHAVGRALRRTFRLDIDLWL